MRIWLLLSLALTALFAGCNNQPQSIDFGPSGDDADYEEPGYQ